MMLNLKFLLKNNHASKVVKFFNNKIFYKIANNFFFWFFFSNQCYKRVSYFLPFHLKAIMEYLKHDLIPCGIEIVCR